MLDRERPWRFTDGTGTGKENGERERGKAKEETGISRRTMQAKDLRRRLDHCVHCVCIVLWREDGGGGLEGDIRQHEHHEHHHEHHHQHALSTGGVEWSGVEYENRLAPSL